MGLGDICQMIRTTAVPSFELRGRGAELGKGCCLAF